MGERQPSIVITKHKLSGEFSLSRFPQVHASLDAAVAEAKRLAAKDTSKIFIAVPLTEAFAYQAVAKVTL